MTVSSTAEAFHVDSTNLNPIGTGGRTPRIPYIGFKAIYTGCKNNACLEPQYPILASSIVSEPHELDVQQQLLVRSAVSLTAIYDAFFNTTPTRAVPAERRRARGLPELHERRIGARRHPAPRPHGRRADLPRLVGRQDRGRENLDADRVPAHEHQPDDERVEHRHGDFIQDAIADGAIKPTWYQQDLELALRSGRAESAWRHHRSRRPTADRHRRRLWRKRAAAAGAGVRRRWQLRQRRLSGGGSASATSKPRRPSRT